LVDDPLFVVMWVAVGQAKEWKKWLKQAPKTHKEWAKKTTQALEKAEEEKQ